MDGGQGVVIAVRITPTPQPMFNLTVDEAHTFFVGEQDWLVHNDNLDCDLNSIYSNVSSHNKPLLGHGAGEGRLDELPRYGVDWQGASTDKTLGIFEARGHEGIHLGDVYLESGYKGPTQMLEKQMEEIGGTLKGTGMDNIYKSHVEAHVGAITRMDENIVSGTLYINQPICQGCVDRLSGTHGHYLRQGVTITVVAPGSNPITFIGRSR